MLGNVAHSTVLSVRDNVFDLNNQTDVLRLLNYVRQNLPDPDLKSETRDLILDYTFAKNPAHLAVITETLQSVGVEIVDGNLITDNPKSALQLKNESVTSVPFGYVRPQPSFQVKITPITVSDRTTKPLATPLAVTSLQVDELQTSTVDLKTTDNKLTETKSEVVDKVVPKVDQKKSDTDYQVRIQEIKRLVNEKIGNPVNLIDVNNQVGREYMNALLDAMKKVNGAKNEEVALAMQRLEKAFVDVTDLLQSPIKVGMDKVQTKQSLSTHSAESSQISAPITKPKGPVPVPEVIAVDIPPAAMSVTPETRLRSVASNTMQDARTANTFSKSVVQVDSQQSNTELVDKGLTQLLSEWKLFKSSGLFGIGPNGREHPLYLKLAHLPMAALVSGRFEGVTPEIRQSLTDYMNGWRYEQGVVHNIDETFENYLKRVISTILDKQKKLNK